jgi:hypothetical protein
MLLRERPTKEHKISIDLIDVASLCRESHPLGYSKNRINVTKSEIIQSRDSKSVAGRRVLCETHLCNTATHDGKLLQPNIYVKFK